MHKYCEVVLNFYCNLLKLRGLSRNFYTNFLINELSNVNRLAFQDKWIKLPLEPEKFMGLSFVLSSLKHGRHAEREKNKQKPRK